MKRRDVTRPLHPPVQITDREIEATYIYVYIYIYLASDRSCASSRSLRFKKAGSLISRDESRQGGTGTYTSDYRRGR